MKDAVSLVMEGRILVLLSLLGLFLLPTTGLPFTCGVEEAAFPRSFLTSRLEKRLVGPTSAKISRDTECKNCPYSNCLNAGVLRAGDGRNFSCWTQGDDIAGDRTWLRHSFGTKLSDFCYITPFDLAGIRSSYRMILPYCGQKSELKFYLPNITTVTKYFTECSLCPYRDCEGVAFFQEGTPLQVDCQVPDGWLQFSPSNEEGTRKYYRTSDNCYVSVANVKEVPRAPSSSHPDPNSSQQDSLPLCGPIPHLRLMDKPYLTARSLSEPNLTPSSSSPSTAMGTLLDWFKALTSASSKVPRIVNT